MFKNGYFVQRARKRFVNLAKQDPGRARQSQEEKLSKGRKKFLPTTYKPVPGPLYMSQNQNGITSQNSDQFSFIQSGPSASTVTAVAPPSLRRSRLRLAGRTGRYTARLASGRSLATRPPRGRWTPSRSWPRWGAEAAPGAAAPSSRPRRSSPARASGFTGRALTVGMYVVLTIRSSYGSLNYCSVRLMVQVVLAYPIFYSSG